MLASIFYIGIMASIIETWGVEKSASYIQAYLASWALGSLLGPLITNIFVNSIADSPVCGNVNATLDRVDMVDKKLTVEGIFWPYLITSVIWLISGLSLLFISHHGLRSVIRNKIRVEAF